MVTPVRWGTEFLVNTTTTNVQDQPTITALADGRFVVAWRDFSQSGGDVSVSAVRAQIFNANGTKSGGEFLINTTTTNAQAQPTITALADGRFVVAWTDDSQTGGDTSGPAVRAQVFNANGTKSGGEPLVNTRTANEQYQPTIAALSDGRFAVAWTDNSQTAGDTSSFAVRAQVFNANGTKSGGELLVNTTTTSLQVQPTITALADGRFVVAWTDLSQTGGDVSSFAVRAQVFNANGSKFGGELLVNATTTNGQFEPAITALADGRIAVAWTDSSATGGDTSGWAVRARVFNADGSTFGSEILVNTTTASFQMEATIAALADGRFVVAWTDESQTGGDTSDFAVRAQVFNPDGSKSGDEFLVNTTTASIQGRSTITALADGRIVVSWADFSQTGGDTSGWAVRAQILDPRLEGVKLKGTKLPDDWVGTPFKDKMKGKGGADILDGGGKKDKLEGGKGPDDLIGGPGGDRFIFKSIKDSKKKDPDAILDFSRKQGDQLLLSAIDAKKGGKDNKFDYIGKDKFSGDAGELRYKVKQGDALVMGDVTGNGKANFAILIDDVKKLKDGDFVL